MNISTESFDVQADINLEAKTAEIDAYVVIAEENEEKCAALVAFVAADVKLIVFTRKELLQKMYEVLAKAATVDVDGVLEIEQDIDDVRNGAAMADFAWYFEL